MSRTIIRTPLTSDRYDSTYDVRLAGELLAVGINPDPDGRQWAAWFLADPDEIPTPRRIAIIAEGMPLPDGDWRHVSTITTDSWTWFALVEQEAQ